MIERRVLEVMEELQITREEAVKALDLLYMAEEWAKAEDPVQEEKNR